MFNQSYASMSSAKRGAVRAKLQNPIFTKIEGRIQVTEQLVVVKESKRRVTVSTLSSPVSIFREIFAKDFGKLTRKEIITNAVTAGVAKNTAATYYQKLAQAAKG